MKRLFILVIIPAILLIMSCKKSDTNGYWTFKGNTYYLDSSQFVIGIVPPWESALFAYSVSQLTILFTDSVPSSGTYKIIGFNNVTSAPRQCSVTIQLAVPYDSVDNDSAYATVTVTGGKVKVTISNVWLVNANNPSDSAQLTAIVTNMN